MIQRKNINPDEEDEVTEIFWAPTMRRWYVLHLILKASSYFLPIKI